MCAATCSALDVVYSLQEAQLSPRDRATLFVIEYFAVTLGHLRSFKIRNDTMSRT